MCAYPLTCKLVHNERNATACRALQLQGAIGAKNACAFDLTAACSGFVLGLITAAQYIRTGSSKRVLVVGGDALSRFIDWKDRGKLRLGDYQDRCQSVLCMSEARTQGSMEIGLDRKACMPGTCLRSPAIVFSFPRLTQGLASCLGMGVAQSL